MSIQIRVTKDEITPDLRRKIARLQDPAPILRALGTQLVSLARRAFRDASLRQKPWPSKKSGPSNLIFKGVLMSSIRVTSVTRDSVSIGSDRRYAAIHQLGGVIQARPGKRLVFNIGGKTIFAKKVTMPARPFFPFLPNGSLAPVAVGPVREALRAAVEVALR